MISIINQTFEQNIANNIIKYLQHPAATMIKDHFEKSDDDEWKTVCGFTATPGRYDITYGGAPSGGIVRLRNSRWYERRQEWGGRKKMKLIPKGKQIIWRQTMSQHTGAIKIVDSSYELRRDPYFERYLDDILPKYDSYSNN